MISMCPSRCMHATITKKKLEWNKKIFLIFRTIMGKTEKTTIDRIKQKLKAGGGSDIAKVLYNFNISHQSETDGLVALVWPAGQVSSIPAVNGAVGDLNNSEDGFGTNATKDTVATTVPSNDGSSKNLVVTRWRNIIPRGTVIEDIIIVYIGFLVLLHLYATMTAIADGPYSNIFFLLMKSIALISVETLEVEILEEYTNEWKNIIDSWKTLQKDIVDDPLFGKHSEKLKELFQNAKSYLLNIINSFQENFTTNVQPSSTDEKSVSKYIEIQNRRSVQIDNAMTNDQDLIVSFLFQHSMQDLESLLKYIFFHYVYKTTIHPEEKEKLEMLSEVLHYGYLWGTRNEPFEKI